MLSSTPSTLAMQFGCPGSCFASTPDTLFGRLACLEWQKARLAHIPQAPRSDYTHHQQCLGISQKAADVLYSKRPCLKKINHFLKQLLLGLGLRRVDGEKGNRGKESDFSLIWWKMLCCAQLYLLLTGTTWTRNTLIKNNVPCRA